MTAICLLGLDWVSNCVTGLSCWFGEVVSVFRFLPTQFSCPISKRLSLLCWLAWPPVVFSLGFAYISLPCHHPSYLLALSSNPFFLFLPLSLISFFVRYPGVHLSDQDARRPTPLFFSAHFPILNCVHILFRPNFPTQFGSFCSWSFFLSCSLITSRRAALFLFFPQPHHTLLVVAIVFELFVVDVSLVSPSYRPDW